MNGVVMFLRRFFVGLGKLSKDFMLDLVVNFVLVFIRY